MSLESLLVWGLAVAIVVGVVVVYFLRFERRVRRDRHRKAEAARLGIDRPGAQFPFIDAHHCVGCGACVSACPEGDVLGVVGGTAVVVNGLRCVGHALCEEACPVGAIEVGLGDLKQRQDVPRLDEDLQTTVPGLFVAGELGGLSLVRNAVEQGRRAVAGIARELGARPRPAPEGARDLLIVGGGPAGLSAALEATSRDLSFLVLEREPDLGGTLLHYPRRKMVLNRPVELPPWGALDREEYRKEELLEIFSGITRDYRLPVHFGRPVEDLSLGEEGFRLKAGPETFAARYVLLAQGRRGLPRRLGVPGEELPKVMYRLKDAESYRGRKILVVGGGDSAVEAAHGLALQAGNRVTLSYRREKLVRIKKKNQEAIDRLIGEGRVEGLFSSRVERIDEKTVHLLLEGGERRTLENDFVFIFAGGIPPFELLRKAGALFGGPGDPGARRD